MKNIVYILLSVLAAYLVYIVWRSRARGVEGFLEGDVSGSYYMPIRDSMFTADGDYTYDDDPNEVIYYSISGNPNTIAKTAVDMGGYRIAIATLDQLRREAGYGMSVCSSGFVKRGNGDYISVYPNTSHLGMQYCGGRTYEQCVSDRGDCSGGILMEFSSTVANGVYIYGNKRTALRERSILGFTMVMQPFNTITRQWSRYDHDPRLKALETYVVYPVDPTHKFDASGSDAQMLDICKEYDSSGTLATIQQIKTDQAAGANWKRPGWLGEDNPRKEVYPISDDARAGTRCMLGSGADEECKAQVYETKTVNIETGSSLKSGGIVCYGKKPAFKDAEKTFDGKVYRAEFFNTYTARWSKYSTPEYKCAASDLTTSTADPERNYLRRAAKYVKAMQTAGAHITLGKDSNAEYPGCGAGVGDDASGCWACSPIPGTDARAATAPTEPKSQSGNWKSIGETIDPTASLTDVAMDVSTVGGKAKLKRGIELILACQRGGGVPTVGFNTNYPGCGTGWCCAPDNQFTLDVGTIGGAEAAGECEPAEPACIPSELVPTQAVAGFKRQCKPRLAQSIRDTKVNRGSAAAAATAANADKLKASVMRDVAQQLKADKLYSLCMHA